jgi:voltage-gated potassium channel
MPLLRAHNLPPGMAMMKKADPGHAMYFVAVGEVEMEAGEHRRSFVSGEVFGGIAPSGGSTSQGTFRTLTRCRLLKLYRDDFRRLERAHPEMTKRIRHAAATCMGKATS